MEMLRLALLLGVAGQAAGWALAPLPAVGRSLAAAPGRCRAAPRLGLRMDIMKRLGNVAKDKAKGAKEWVDSGAKADRDVNVRGAASGAVIGVRRPRRPARACVRAERVREALMSAPATGFGRGAFGRGRRRLARQGLR